MTCMTLKCMLIITHLTLVTVLEISLKTYTTHSTTVTMKYWLPFVRKIVIQSTLMTIAAKTFTTIFTFTFSDTLHMSTGVALHHFRLIPREVMASIPLVVAEAAWKEILAYITLNMATTGVVFTPRNLL